MKSLNVNINYDDLPPSGLRDFFLIVSSTDESKGTEESRMNDKSRRKFQLRMILNKRLEFFDNINLNADEKSGSSFLLVPDKADRILINYRYGLCTGIRNDRNELSSIVGEIETTGWLEALTMFVDGLSPIIDALSYSANCPTIISRVYCVDIKNIVEVITYNVPYRMSTMNQHIGYTYTEMMPIMALYREAKNTQSPFYKFLCYYKILEGIFENIRPKFFKMLRKNKLSIKTLEENLEHHQAIDSSYSNLIGKSISHIYQNLFTAKFRNVVAHFILKDGRILNVSDFRANNDFLAVLTILEQCVRKVIDNQNKYFDMYYREQKKSN
jgi:hypothetical protein